MSQSQASRGNLEVSDPLRPKHRETQKDGVAIEIGSY